MTSPSIKSIFLVRFQMEIIFSYSFKMHVT